MIADSSKPNKVRNVYTIRSTARNVTIQKWKIYYIKGKVIAFIINFRRNNSILNRKMQILKGGSRQHETNFLNGHLQPTGYSQTQFRRPIHSSAATTLGHPSRKHQDWFDENDDELQRLLEEKHRLHKAHQDDIS